MLLASPIKEIKAFGVFGFPNLDGTTDLDIWLEIWNGQRFGTLGARRSTQIAPISGITNLQLVSIALFEGRVHSIH